MAAPELERNILGVAFRLIAESGFDQLNLRVLAEESGEKLSDIARILPAKTAIFMLMTRHVDASMVGQISPNMAGVEETIRSRLFELLMNRFDALAFLKPGLLRLAKRPDPVLALQITPLILGSMALALEAAGVSSTGAEGALRVVGLTMVYRQAFNEWLTDTGDLSRTMKILDEGLARAETRALRWPFKIRGAAAREVPTDNALIDGATTLDS